MDKEITKAASNITEGAGANKNFKGYTIEELRYQRALVALQKEFCKSRVLHKAERVKHRKFGSEKKDGGSKFALVGSVANKLLTGLSYLDYAMIGMSLFGSGRKVYKFFKRAKKN